MCCISSGAFFNQAISSELHFDTAVIYEFFKSKLHMLITIYQQKKLLINLRSN